MQVIREKDWNPAALRDIRYGKRKPILIKALSVNGLSCRPVTKKRTCTVDLWLGGENSNEINFISYEHEDAISALRTRIGCVLTKKRVAKVVGCLYQ